MRPAKSKNRTRKYTRDVSKTKNGDRIQTVTVYTLVEKYTLTVPEAVARFRRGPQYEPCELEMMQADLMKHLSEDATEKLQAHKDRM